MKIYQSHRSSSFFHSFFQKRVGLSLLFILFPFTGYAASTPTTTCFDTSILDCCEEATTGYKCDANVIYPTTGGSKPDTACSSGYDLQIPVTNPNTGATILISVITGVNAAVACGGACCYCKPTGTVYQVVPPPNAGSSTNYQTVYDQYCNPNPNSTTGSSSSTSGSSSSTSATSANSSGSGSSSSSSGSSSTTSGTSGSTASTNEPQPPSGQGYINRNAACTACGRYGHSRSDCTEGQVLMKYTLCDGTVDTVCAPARGTLVQGKTCGAPIIVSSSGSSSTSGSSGSSKTAGSSTTTGTTSTSTTTNSSGTTQSTSVYDTSSTSGSTKYDPTTDPNYDPTTTGTIKYP